MRVYLAEASSGEYDDFRSWVVGIFTTLPKAKRGCQASLAEGSKALEWSYSTKDQVSQAQHDARYSWDRIDFDVRLVETDTLV